MQTRLTRTLIGMSLATLLTAGSALADDISCALGAQACFGTNNPDVITGSDGADLIFAQGADDEVRGGLGNDHLEGDSESAPELNGADMLNGGPGDDALLGLGGDDIIKGGAGNDDIDAAVGENGATDTVKAGKGNDRIVATDGVVDVIDCGPGHDEVTYDKHVDTVVRCEIQHPVLVP